jgi:8-oxo-dGTP diphosphatase
MSAESVAPRVGVGVFIFKDGKFLIGQRRGSHGAETWSVPGGHLELGETPEQTAIREVREETGLEITNVTFAAVTNDIFSSEGKHYVTLWMKSEWQSGEATITEPDKFIEQRWVDFSSLPEPLFLPWQQLLASEFIEPLRDYARQSSNRYTK